MSRPPHFLLVLLLSAATAAASPAPALPTQDPRLPDLDRAALVLIEFQNEWLDENGKLNHLMEDRAQFDRAIAGAREALAVAREHGMVVIHVGLRFAEGYPELTPGRHGLRAAIPAAGTWRAGTYAVEFAAGFEPRQGEPVVTGRNGASGFAGSNLHSILRDHGVETLYLAGFALHVCVESTLREAHDRGYETIVLEDATAAFTREQRAYVFDHVMHHYGEAIDNVEFARRARSIEPRSTPDRHDLGWQRLRFIDGQAGEALVDGLAGVAPDLGRHVIEFAFGEVYDPARLDLRSRQIATVAALTAMGGAESQLRVHVNAALNVGVTADEIVAVMTQMSVYAGFPRALNAVGVAREVFERRGRELDSSR